MVKFTQKSTETPPIRQISNSFWMSNVEHWFKENFHHFEFLREKSRWRQNLKKGTKT
jgi:hypothetical protein